MKLSRKQFEQLLKKNELVLSLIGMSNIGKTYWAKKLADINFEHINCDDLIEAKLAPELKRRGYSGIKDVSRWMGHPYDKRFFAHQQKYLDFEKEVMKEILTKLKNLKRHNIAIDTTGSIVHTGDNICSQLKKRTLIVYLQATEPMKEELFRRYAKKEPKPVVFGDVFESEEKRINKQTLKKCYLRLLDLRNALYAKYADVIIPRPAIGKNMSTGQFILLIKKSLIN